jgi:hypothetical protein
MVQVCEPEARRNLSDNDNMRSAKYLSDFQVRSEGNTDCQMGNEMGFEDLIDFQEGNREFPIFQMGMGT